MLPFICKSCRRAMRIAPPAVNHGSVAASLNQNLNKSTVKAPTVLVNFDGRDITFYFPQSFSVTMSWPVLQWQRRRRKIAITVTTSRRRTCQIKHRTRRARDRRARTPVSWRPTANVQVASPRVVRRRRRTLLPFSSSSAASTLAATERHVSLIYNYFTCRTFISVRGVGKSSVGVAVRPTVRPTR